MTINCKSWLKYFFIGLIVFLNTVPAVTCAQEKSRIGISRTALGFLPTIVAEKKGFYAKYNLASEHVMISLSIAMHALLTGDLGYAVTVGQGISSALAGIPVKLVMLTQDNTTFLLLAKPGVQKITDLRGKTIGISSYGSTIHLTAVSLLRHFGMEPGKDINLLPGGDIKGNLTALETGQLDAVFHDSPLHILGAEKGYKVLLWARDYVPLPISGIVVSDRKLNQNRDEVKRLIKGTIEALQFLRERKDESISIAAQWMKLDRNMIRAIYDIYPYSVDGTMTDHVLRSAISMELERIKTKKEVPISLVADRALLSEAQRELGIKK